MAGEDDRPSIRRRFTTLKSSLKRVISSSSDKSDKSKPKAESSKAATAEPAKPAETTVATQPITSVSEKADRKKKEPPGTPPVPVSAAERAQALFRKHGLEIKPEDWPVRDIPPGQREHKEIRMRVHRTCHKCDTTYGPDKECRECGHKRCKKCPRYPAKKAKDRGNAAAAPTTQAEAHAKVGYKKRKGDIAYGITLPSKTGGQDLVRKTVRQRVHRKCHRCESDFAGEKVCGKCKHNRCKKCPREPMKASKPPGYYDKYDPSDSEPDQPVYAPRPRKTYRRPRMRVHWTCGKCQTPFLSKTYVCSECGSNRDDTGIRYPPKKDKSKKKGSTDDELQRLQERLKQTTLSGTAA